MGITVQYRAFGTYPNPALASIPGDEQSPSRRRDWRTVKAEEDYHRHAGTK